jgi:hypothetical protein
MATASDYVAALEAFLLTNSGVSSIRHPDGRQITFDRKQAMAELAYWKSQVSAASTSIFGSKRFRLNGDA